MGRMAKKCALGIAWSLAAGAAFGQPSSPSNAELLEQIERLTRRMEALEHQHRKDQARIEQLEERVGELTAVKEQPRGGVAEAGAPVESEPPEVRAETGPFDLSASAMGSGNLLNPRITVFWDGGASLSNRGRNRALNRFNLREVELDLRAAITPGVDGVMIVTLEEEIDQERSGDISVDRDVDIEEGYLSFHSLPYDLALKLGKFRNVFGRNNLLHTHDLPQVTRPLAVRSFLGPEGLLTTGASLSWLVPNPWDKYVEATLEVVNDDGGATSPILGGPNVDNPAVLGHLKFFDDITDTSSFEIGGSYLFAKTASRSGFDANVAGLDLTYQWVHPDPSLFRSLMLQSELFWARNDIDRGFFRSSRNNSFGAYAFAQYQLNRDWYAGLRADYTEFPNSESRSAGDYDFALSPNVTWYLSEFLRSRLEFQHRTGSDGDEDAVFLQLTGVIGTHPPHPYWVHR